MRVIHEGYEDESFGTVDDLIAWMEERDIPRHARIEYAGCGSHQIAFVWRDETDESGYWASL